MGKEAQDKALRGSGKGGPTTARQRGLSLIDALLAIAVFDIVAVGAGLAMTSSAQTDTLARRESAATNLARSKLEELRNTPYTTLASGSDAGLLPESNASTAGIYTRSWTVTGNQPVGASSTVAVSVGWADPSGTHQVNLSTIVAQ